MTHAFSRTELLIGQEGLDRLKKVTVAVFGIGGVGSFAVEGLVRAGVGHFVLVDDDTVCLTNLNRQLHATHSTLGRPKVEVMRERMLDINPDVEVEVQQRFYLPETGRDLIRKEYDYLVDAIDTVTAKIDLIVQAKALGVPIISCMGAGNKLDPSRFEVADLAKTSVCPLARVMRRELKLRGIHHLKVVYSKEERTLPLKSETDVGMESDAALDRESDEAKCVDDGKGLQMNDDKALGVNADKVLRMDDDPVPGGGLRPGKPKKVVPGSISFVPSVAGLLLAGEVVRDLLKDEPGTAEG